MDSWVLPGGKHIGGCDGEFLSHTFSTPYIFSTYVNVVLSPSSLSDLPIGVTLDNG